MNIYCDSVSLTRKGHTNAALTVAFIAVVQGKNLITVSEEN